MFEAIGRFSYRFRWIVIGIWIVIFGVSLAAAPFLEDVLTGGFAEPDPHLRSRRLPLSRRSSHKAPRLSSWCSRSGISRRPVPSSRRRRSRRSTDWQEEQIPGLESIQTYASTGSALLLSEDGMSTVAVLNFSATEQAVQGQVGQIREALRATVLDTYVTGEPAIYADVSSYSFRDLRKVEIYGLPVALIALILVFGSLVAAALPVIIGGVAVTVTLGGMFLMAQVTSMSIFAMNVATLLGLAVAIDYALFIVWRFREELHKGASVKEAVVVTTARAGRSVFYSGAAVLVGVVGLIFFPSPGIRSLGIGGALVVFFSVAASVTLMPALLAVVGRRINSIPVIRLHEAHDSPRWRRWARIVLRWPWVSIVVVLVLITLIAYPAATMKTQMTSAATLPPEAESRRGVEILDQDFDRQALSPTMVLLSGKVTRSIDVTRAASLFMYGQQILALDGVASIQSPFTIGGLGDSTALAALWPQFEQLLNDPDGFVVPAEGITLESGTDHNGGRTRAVQDADSVHCRARRGALPRGGRGRPRDDRRRRSGEEPHGVDGTRRLYRSRCRRSGLQLRLLARAGYLVSVGHRLGGVHEPHRLRPAASQRGAAGAGRHRKSAHHRHELRPGWFCCSRATPSRGSSVSPRRVP